MSKVIKLRECMICLICLLSTLAWGTTWKLPPRRVEIGKDKILTLRAGQTVIVVPKKPCSVLALASEELSELLGQVLGGEIPIVTEAVPDKVPIFLGLEALRPLGVDAKELCRDGYHLRTTSQGIYIGGVDDEHVTLFSYRWLEMCEMGTLFGVYGFLERFAGARFYFPGELGTILPRKNELSLPKVSIFDRPDFMQRYVSNHTNGTWYEGENPTDRGLRARRINHYRMKLATVHIPCCHGMNDFWYMKRFGQKRPDFLALLSNGSRSTRNDFCYTNKDFQEEIYRDICSYLKGEDAGVRDIHAWNSKKPRWGNNVRTIRWDATTTNRYVDIMPQDGFNPCQCAACQRAYRKGDSDYATELIWGNTIGFAKRLQKDKIPGYLTQMAYTPYARVPDFDIPDNVMVMVARRGPWSTVDRRRYAKETGEILEWSRKVHGRIWLWNYANKYGAMNILGVPQMAPRAYGEYYAALAPYVFGANPESESDRYLFNYLNFYVYSRIAWDNAVDWKAVLNEHYELMFGKARSIMKDYYEELEDIWLQKIAGRTVDTPLGPMGAPPSDKEIWTKIYGPDTLERMGRQLDKAAACVPEKSLEQRRIALIRREFHDSLKMASQNYFLKTAAVHGLTLHVTDKPSAGVCLLPLRKKDKDGEATMTRVHVWKAGNALNVRFTCDEPHMDRVVVAQRKKDDARIWTDNSVEIFLNPSADRKNYFQLLINSKGCLTDLAEQAGLGAHGDSRWDSNADVRVETNNQGWIATVSIPLSNFPTIKDTFPVNFTRSRILRDGTEKLYIWSPFARGFHDIENFGTLVMGDDANLLSNGDFSQPIESKNRKGWILSDGKSVQLDEEVLVSAPASLRFSKEGQAVYYLPMLKPKTRYKLTYHVKWKDVKNGRPYHSGPLCRVWDHDVNYWYPPFSVIYGTSDWQLHTFEFETGPLTNVKNPSYLALALGGHATGTAWFDNVRLVEVNEN